MIETLTAVGLALLFGLGVAFTVLGSTLFYRIYIASENYNSPLIITTIAFVLLWIGSTCLYFVTV